MASLSPYFDDSLSESQEGLWLLQSSIQKQLEDMLARKEKSRRQLFKSIPQILNAFILLVSLALLIYSSVSVLLI